MQNFERSEDVLKSLNIGVKIYRCGHCGNICDSTGLPLPDDSEEFKRSSEILDKIGDSKTELVHGDCCVHEDLKFTQMLVTRDMALDAGDPSLEGTYI